MSYKILTLVLSKSDNRRPTSWTSHLITIWSVRFVRRKRSAWFARIRPVARRQSVALRTQNSTGRRRHFDKGHDYRRSNHNEITIAQVIRQRIRGHDRYSTRSTLIVRRFFLLCVINRLIGLLQFSMLPFWNLIILTLYSYPFLCPPWFVSCIPSRRGLSLPI